MSRSARRVASLILACTAFVAAGLWLVVGWNPAGNPRVQGRRLSAWFQAVNERYWFANYRERPVPPDLRRALEAFREAGLDAVPLLLSHLVPAERHSLAETVRKQLRRVLGGGFQPADAFQFQGTTARGLLRFLDLPGPVLVTRLEPALTSTNMVVRDAAIRCLGEAGSGWDVVADRLRPLLGDADPSTRRPALVAVGRLGREAVRVCPELVALARAGAHLPGLAEALGNCGPAARDAVPFLEARWAATTDGGERLTLALALCRIQPSHAQGVAFLDSVARGGEASAAVRVKPAALASALAQLATEDRRLFAGLFPPLLEWAGQAKGGTYRSLVEAMNGVDPGEVDRRLRADMAAEPNGVVRCSIAGELLRLQPTNAFAREVLREAVRTDASGSWSSGRTLLLCGEEDPEILRLLRAQSEDRRLPVEIRRQLGELLAEGSGR